MKKELNKELQEVGPFLLNEKLKKGMTVPDNYFDKLSNEIIDKLDQESQVQSKKTKSPWAWSTISVFPKWAFAMASILLLAFFLWPNIENGGSEFQVDLGDLTDEEILQYASNYFNISELNVDDEEITIYDDSENLTEEDLNLLLDDIDIYDLEELELL